MKNPNKANSLGQSKALFGLCIPLRFILHKPNTTFAFR